MAQFSDFERRMWESVETVAKNRKIDLEWHTSAEARLHKAKLTAAQKQLRLIKKDIAQAIRELNAVYATKTAGVGKGIGSALAGGLFGKRNASKVNVLNRQQIRNQQLSAVEPYRRIDRQIDNILLQLDQLKLQLDEWVTKQSAAAQD